MALHLANALAIWLLVLHSVLGHGASIASCCSGGVAIGRWDLLTPSLSDVKGKLLSIVGRKGDIGLWKLHDPSALQSYSLPVVWAKGTVNLELIFLLSF